MMPTDVLSNEHKVILEVIAAAEREAASIQSAGRAHLDRVEKMLDFFRNFADRCHHAKEEKHLFTRMQERSVRGDIGPIAVMLKEHDLGRQHLKAVADAMSAARGGDAGALETIERNLAGYASLLRSHIYKEDNVLYPFANNVLTQQDQQELLKEFDSIERNEMKEGDHERFHNIAKELSRG